MVFPPYGRSKGAPIAGASVQDLEFYISGSRRSLDDPSKSRWHDKERVLLAAMEAELARRNDGEGGGGAYSRDAGGGAFGRDPGAFGRDAGGGSYGRDTGGGYGRGAAGGSVGAEDFDVPPNSDDDIPF